MEITLNVMAKDPLVLADGGPSEVQVGPIDFPYFDLEPFSFAGFCNSDYPQSSSRKGV